MKPIPLSFIFLLFAVATSAQKVMNIWPGSAPGSENLTWHEQVDTTAFANDPIVYDVAQPTLTFFPADPALASGAAVIICPGGSFCYLHINTEGIDVARWLNKKGVSAFVLKYRLVHSETEHPLKELIERRKDTASSAKLFMQAVPLAIADGRQALIYVRKHASEFGVAPDKIGIIGFSAGGTLAVANALNYTAENRPDFAVPMYAYVPPAWSMDVPKDAPPLFIAAATDDEYHLVPMSINLYSKWLASGHSAEMHIYSKGGHGFGMNRYNLPSDTWIDRLGEWMQLQGLLRK
ncbi:MAG: alpha/beta hydrolase [Bacteroidota bacterium]|nr:alpha/beta hydrolase [Bacteroidota bacterium]